MYESKQTNQYNCFHETLFEILFLHHFNIMLVNQFSTATADDAHTEIEVYQIMFHGQLWSQKQHFSKPSEFKSQLCQFYGKNLQF